MKIHYIKQGNCLWMVLSVLFLLSNNHYSSAAETGTIRLGIPLQAQSTIMIVAADQDYFAKEGLKVTVKEYLSGARALNDGLFAGEVDAVSTAEVPAVFASFIRDDFNILASVGTIDKVLDIVARKKSEITRPGDFKGKRIATQKGSAMHFFLHLFLLKNHLSEKDVKLSFKKIEEMPDALARGEIDAFSGREPFTSQAKAKLGSDGIVIFDERGLYAPIDIVISTKKLVRENPNAAKSILKALIRAEEFIKKQPEDAMKIVGKKLNVPVTDIAESWSQSSFKVELPQSMILTLEDEARWVRNSKLVESKTIPNYLDYIHIDSLKSVRPRSVGIIR